MIKALINTIKLSEPSLEHLIKLSNDLSSINCKLNIGQNLAIIADNIKKDAQAMQFINEKCSDRILDLSDTIIRGFLSSE